MPTAVNTFVRSGARQHANAASLTLINHSVWEMEPIDPVISTTLRVVLAVIFLVAAGHKLSDLPGFRATLDEYRLLPRRLHAPAAVTFPVVELVVALALLTDGTASIAALMSLVLLCLYTLAIGVNLLRGRRDIDCGCSGPAMKQTLSEWLLVRNGVLLVVAMLCVVPATARPFVWLDFLTTAFAVLTFLLLYTAGNFLIANGPRLKALFS